MLYTNKLNLPEYLFDWLITDNYDHNDDPYTISATTLMKPTRATILALRHLDKLEQDVSDLIAARIGTAIHDSIEKVNSENVKKEVRKFKEIRIGSAIYKISGKYDLLIKEENNTFSLRDIKSTSVWAYVLGGKDNDYRHQLSIYRWLDDETFINDVAYIDFFFTDWQASKAKQDKDYPKQRILPSYEINLLSKDEIEKYIVSRLSLIEEAKNKSDDDLKPCTKLELWAQDEKFAVYKNGNKKATKLCSSFAEAKKYMNEKSIDGFIENRQPKVKRCNYCVALPFCNQGQSYARQGLIL